MKTVKSIILKLFLTTLIILSVSNCRTKQLNTQKSRTSERHAEDITIQTKQNESYQGNRVILMSDSNNHQYRVKIFPLDTFSFSPEGGFKGKASSIEVFGLMQQRRKILDSTVVAATKQSKIQYDHEINTRKTESSSSKALKKKSLTILPFLLWIGVIGLIVWVYRRVWNKTT